MNKAASNVNKGTWSSAGFRILELTSSRRALIRWFAADVRIVDLALQVGDETRNVKKSVDENWMNYEFATIIIRRKTNVGTSFHSTSFGCERLHRVVFP